MEKEYEKVNSHLLIELIRVTFFIAICNWMIQFFRDHHFANMVVGSLFVLFTVIITLIIKAQDKPIKNAKVLIYLYQSICLSFMMVQVIYLNHPRNLVLFLLMMVYFPTLIIDELSHVWGYSVLVGSIFLFCDYSQRDFPHFLSDAIYVVVLLFFALGVSLIGLSSRRKNITNVLKIKGRSRLDVLTGMHNVRALDEDRSSYYHKHLGVIGMDIDNFKMINEIYGHFFGDQVMKAFSYTFISLLGQDHTYRYHDDLLISFVDEQEFDALQTYQAMESSLKNMTIDGKQIHILFSACYLHGDIHDNDDFREMLRDLDFALKEAKGDKKLISYSFKEAKERFDDEYLKHRLSLYHGDALTHMLEMNHFYELGKNRLPEMIQPVLIYLNFRNFKSYNERYGRDVGDQLLMTLSNRIHEIFDEDLAGRFYGDHFYILSEKDHLNNRLDRLIDRMHFSTFSAPSLAIGVYIFDQKRNLYVGCDNAKFAGDFIKENMSISVQYYDEQLATKKRAYNYVNDHFEEALAHHDIKVYYQPIVRAVSKSMCNAEALSRWQVGDQVISPAQYIPILESLHLIYQLDLYMLDQVIADLSYKYHQGEEAVPVSINLSGYDFEDCDIVSEIIKRVDAAQLPHALIVIEITESIFVASGRMNDYVKAFHEAGFKVWMDDFGSGYSSLNMLKSIDVDLVKLDMKFMKDFDQDQSNRLMVADLIQIAQRMGRETLAEGVETKETFDALRMMGCAKIQGYYISQPLDLETLMEKQKTIVLESAKESKYCDAISHVNLSDPFVLYPLNEELAVKVPPRAVVELVDDTTFYVLRGNKEYYSLIRDVDFTNDGHKLIKPLSKPFMEGLHRCFESHEWESIIRSPEQGFYMNSLVHVVAKLENKVSFIIYITYIQKITDEKDC